MTMRILTGNVAKFSLNDSSFIFYIGKDPELFSVSRTEPNYNAITAALLVASANNYQVSIKSEVDGRSISLLTVQP